jgi:predicted AlkP superfamily phosphohydrolase/phosphomutase
MNGSYEYTPTTSLDGRAKTIWETIGERGGKSIVINVPLTYPPKAFKGVMISGFPTPVSRGDYTHPRGLLSSLKERFGNVDIHKPPVLYRKGIEESLTEKLLEITRQQTEITKYLMDSMDWNLTISVYDATDVMGHYFWAYLDRDHPKYDPKLAERVSQEVKDVHIALDHAIGELAEAAGPEAMTLVVSDHGFGPVYYGVYMNNWLLEKGYLHLKNSIGTRTKYWAFKRGLHTYNLLQLAKALRIVRSIESAYSSKSMPVRLLRATALSMGNIDWDTTRVYSSGNLGQLYLNLKGREPRGTVDPKDAEALVSELVVAIKELEDPSTHRRMFDYVRAKSDAFVGDANSNAPDVIFFDEEMKYSAHRMFELGSSKLVTLHPLYSGNHKMDGIMFACGPRIKNISSTSIPGAPPAVVDLAPTILHWLGCDIPDEVDGRPLYELFEDERAPIPGVGVEAGSSEGPLGSEASRIMVGARRLRFREDL